MSVLIIFIKLIAVFDLLVIAVYFGGDILSTMLNKLRRKPKQDDPFDFSLDTVTVSLSIALHHTVERQRRLVGKNDIAVAQVENIHIIRPCIA